MEPLKVPENFPASFLKSHLIVFDVGTYISTLWAGTLISLEYFPEKSNSFRDLGT